MEFVQTMLQMVAALFQGDDPYALCGDCFGLSGDGVVLHLDFVSCPGAFVGALPQAGDPLGGQLIGGVGGCGWQEGVVVANHLRQAA